MIIFAWYKLNSTWELSYRFSAHFHPYVDELVKRLIEGSVRGLEAADTDYVVNPDGTLKIIPSSTVATLTADTQVLIGGVRPFMAVKDTPVILGGQTVQLPSGKRTTLTGDLVVTEPRGLRFTVSDGKETVPFGSRVKLVSPDGANVMLPDGSMATTPPDLEVIIRACKPLPKLYAEFFVEHFAPAAPVRQPYPVKELDFSFSGAYSVYNWELFFHVPLTIAIHLSRNQRFEEALRWFHLVFDPTDDSDGPTPERFWQVKPFQSTDVKLIEAILVNLSTGADPALKQETVNAIRAWKDAPFRPHLVARYRHPAYMFKAVMAYLDNLIVWGDTLFREDTGESINEAAQLYVLAANILGPRPQSVPGKGSVRPRTYATLKKELNEFGNALVALETDIPFDRLPHPNGAGDLDQFTTTLRSLGHTLYFCVPRNDKLLSYWDTVADRLFKIRNSLNLLGVFRQIPLFEPPIDPALLAKAAAVGVDVAAIVNGINQPLPLVRFQVLVQKAAEIVQEVKALGNSLLAAMEKEDGEAMAILRARHEHSVMEMVEHVKYGQHQEAIKSTQTLYRSFSLALQRYYFYERQLGAKTEGINLLSIMSNLDTDDFYNMKLAVEEPEWGLRPIEIDIVQELGESGGKKLNKEEAEELRKLKEARDEHITAATWDKIGSVSAVIPDFGVYATPIGVGGNVTYGGRNFALFAQMISTFHKASADELSYKAGNAAKIGTYVRREQDWAFQSNLAAGEINQIFKQIRAAEIRQAIAELELKNHQQQMKHAEEIERFLNEEGTNKTGKTTNKAFYAWTKREVKGLYGQCFQFAFDIARKAERALQHELGNPELSYLQFGYLAGKEGLLAGEKLYLDIKRMELAYHELNQREYELTKHVSLLQVDPLALIQLRSTGSCTVRLNEDLFDMDGPGHYFRRIKSVAVSIPCVAGPYTSVNCTLTLLKSSIRKTQILRAGVYAREGAEDERFEDYFGSLQSIVTSSGQNDSGLFETNLRDERYLPFENSGVISEWQLELPADVRQFDYDTISDVILHIRYTAREGGGLLRKGAIENLNKTIENAQVAGSVRLFSVRHEFPTEWAKFTAVKIEDLVKTAELKLELRDEHYPFWSRGRLNGVKRVDVIAKTDKTEIKIKERADEQGKKDLLQDTSVQGLLMGTLNNLAPQTPKTPKDKPLQLFFDNNSMADLWIAVTWSG